jgi:DNA-binding response OmpR family regulator
MKKILTIDDDKTLQNVFLVKLQNEGYEVIQAFSGEEGLRMAKNTKPEIILLDIMMPGMDGEDVLKKIKMDPEIQNIPVIMLSNLETEVMNTLQSGAVWYFIKSNTPLSELVSKIEQIIGK